MFFTSFRNKKTIQTRQRRVVFCTAYPPSVSMLVICVSSPVLLVEPLDLVTEAGHQTLHLSRGQPRPTASALPLSVGLQRLPGQHPAPALGTGQAVHLGAQLRVVSTPGAAA